MHRIVFKRLPYLVISEEHKYVFVGIPFSGSTAISNELCLNYGGEPILTKHANLHMLEDAGADLSQYTVAAVIRNPVDQLHTYFSKLKKPIDGRFSDPKFDLRNGGHLRRKDHRLHHAVKARDMSYTEFLNRYHRIPYDNFFSMNAAKLDYVIQFSDLNNSFKTFLERCGITPIRDLPLVNETKKKPSLPVTENIIPFCFRPFLYEYQDLLEIKVSKPNRIYYSSYILLKPFRYLHWRRYDKSVSADGYCSYYEMVRRLETTKKCR